MPPRPDEREMIFPKPHLTSIRTAACALVWMLYADAEEKKKKNVFWAIMKETF